MSDILIHGMDLPDKDHLILVEIDNNGEVFAAYDGGRTKLAQYKAISIQPHGDLIDKDALIEKKWDADTRCGYIQVVDIGDIIDAPVIIKAENK